MSKRFYRENYRHSRDRDEDMELPNAKGEALQDFGKGRPEDSRGEATMYLEKKMIADLPLSSTSINVKADPYQEGRGVEGPYPFYNKNNRIINPRYSGKINVDGGSSMQLYDQPNSGFLNYFDWVNLKLDLNYRFISCTKRMNQQTIPQNVTNYGLIGEMFKAFVERMGQVDASTFTDFAAFNYVVTMNTDVLWGSVNDADYKVWAPYVVTSSGNVVGLTSYAAVFLIMLHYQSYLQRLAATFNVLSKERAYRSHMKTMGWSRENATLEKLWGRFNSSSWLANWVSFSSDMEGEFFDKDWMITVNQLAMLVSRKANAIIEPCTDFTIFPALFATDLKIYANMTTDGQGAIIFTGLFYDASLMASNVSTCKMFSATQADVSLASHAYTFDTATRKLITDMQPSNIQEWARLRVSLLNGTMTGLYSADHKDISNSHTNLVTAASEYFSYFKTAMVGIRKVIEVAIRVKINNWSHTHLGILRNTKVQPAYNTTVSDVLANYLSGSEQITFDEKTGRWVSYTVFNKYYGIPAYDYMQGGSFMSFSLKDIVIPTSIPGIIKKLPYLFGFPSFTAGTNQYDYEKITCQVHNRYGENLELSAVRNFTPDTHPIHARLCPIAPMDGTTIRMPRNTAYFGTPGSTRGVGSRMTVSCFYSFLENFFKSGAVYSSATAIDYVFSSDLMTLLDFEIEDVTNIMIDYARSSGPIRLNDTTPVIGFTLK